MREPSARMPPFESGRDLPAIVSEKSLSPTVEVTNGSLGVSTTSLSVSARAERIRGAVMSAGTSAVGGPAEGPPPPAVHEGGVFPPPRGVGDPRGPQATGGGPGPLPPERGRGGVAR